MKFVLVREGSGAWLFGGGVFDGALQDIVVELSLSTELDGRSVAAWPLGVTSVPEGAAKAVFGALGGSPPTLASTSDGSVVYEEDVVTAYFDSMDRPVPPHFATWAKVWTPDGQGGINLQIVTLSPQTNG